MENRPEKFRKEDFNPLVGARNYFRRCNNSFSRKEGTVSQYRESIAKTIGLAFYNGAIYGTIFTSLTEGLESLIQLYK